jgi:HPt (histidine-containing phosphotransfer) domain-containing protein
MSTELKIKSASLSLHNNSLETGLQQVLAECLGQVDLLHELVRMSKRNILEFIGNVKVNMENEDVEKIQIASYKIKPALRMMHLDSLLQISEQIEIACNTDKDLKHIKFLYNQFIDEYPEVEKALDSQIKKL